MKALTIKKQFIPTLALACLTGLAINNAQAAASFNSTATVTYTINSISNTNNPGDLSGLKISGFSEIDANQSFQYLSGNGSVSPSLVDSGSIDLTPATGNIYTRSFTLSGSASDEAEVLGSYSALFNLVFDNQSAQPANYQIDLTLSYELSTIASGDHAFTDINLSYFNIAENPSGSDYLDASSENSGSAAKVNSQNFTFSLAAQGHEAISLNTAMSGALTSAPVPVPAAVWLFASALLMPGFRRLKSA